MKPGAPGYPTLHERLPTKSASAQINLLIQDSQYKCAEFVNSMFAETAGAGLILDVLSTGTAAVSAIVTPLSTAHALGATTTLLSGTKTGITANYLNTLSVSHITQAIQASYTTDMTNYINSLARLSKDERDNLDVFQERSKILSYHNECSLAAAEGSISSALQTPTPAGQGLSVTYTVKDADLQSGQLAISLAAEINRVFGNAGVTAQPSGANIINLRMTTPFKLTITPATLAQFVSGSGNRAQVKLTGTPKKGDKITIAGPSAQQSTDGGETATAKPAGQNPQTK